MFQELWWHKLEQSWKNENSRSENKEQSVEEKVGTVEKVGKIVIQNIPTVIFNFNRTFYYYNYFLAEFFFKINLGLI